MKKVLVTGGAGFIGRSVVNLLQDNYQVTILDNFYLAHVGSCMYDYVSPLTNFGSNSL